MPPQFAAPAILPSGAWSPRTRAAVVDRGQGRERKQALERQSWDQAKIDRRNGVGMIAQKCPPALRWRSAAPGHVLGDGRLGDLEPELQQFTMDARGAP